MLYDMARHSVTRATGSGSFFSYNEGLRPPPLPRGGLHPVASSPTPALRALFICAGAQISFPALRGGEDAEARDNGRENNSEGGGTRGADIISRPEGRGKMLKPVITGERIIASGGAAPAAEPLVLV